jgi:hypothetical protein
VGSALRPSTRRRILDDNVSSIPTGATPEAPHQQPEEAAFDKTTKALLAESAGQNLTPHACDIPWFVGSVAG